MMQQYLRLRDEYSDCLLLFRLGDFYELFFEDAVTASRELELTLTGRDCGLEERAPMCGVPYHAVNAYVDRLIEKGYKVAICEQMEDPATAKGLVERDVVRVITAGTVTDGASLDEKSNNYLLCVLFSSDTAVGLAWADVTTGEFTAAETDVNSLRAEISRLGAREVLCDDPERLRALAGEDFTAAVSRPKESDLKRRNAERTLTSHFQLVSLTPLGLDGHGAAATAAGALLSYLLTTQKNGLGHLRAPRFEEGGRYMLLDPATRRNLELTDSLRGRGRQGTLLSLLDRTETAMGGRLLRTWMEQPLLDRGEIEARHEAVAELADSPITADSLREALSGVYDLERLISRLAYHSFNARDCLALDAGLKRVPEIRGLLEGASASRTAHGMKSEELRSAARDLVPMTELTELLDRAIDPDAPAQMADGGVIRAGYSAELDEYRAAQSGGRQWILEMEQRERDETGIKNLRIQYNRVFGYYIEVTKSYLSLVPERYTRRQTLANSERYTTPELRETEQKILGAREQSIRLEAELFDGVREAVGARLAEIQRICGAVKKLDVYQSLARAAVENRYVRPVMTDDGSLRISEGRHPVVESSLPDGAFVPNDTEMDTAGSRMMIITGPNMAGKSTYMRQVALICLMAQIGSFVPAKEAVLPVCDRIFTRVGASDDLASGQSTFMVEMTETAYILRNATVNSLIILDEIGRGTSTFDGLAIAWAVVEYIAKKENIGAKTLFATHYHELSELEGHLDGVKNYCVSVREHGEEVIFLRKIVRGGADRSFGIQVARMAGVPHPVIVRAHEIQARLEVSDINQNAIGQKLIGEEETPRESEQVDLFDYRKTEIISELQGIDVMAMTPMDAMNKLFLLREKARDL